MSKKNMTEDEQKEFNLLQEEVKALRVAINKHNANAKKLRTERKRIFKAIDELEKKYD